MAASPNPILIGHLAAKNFLSFGPEGPGIALKSLNVVIGPNGSGKSNLLEAINLMRAAPRDWQDVTRKGGGVEEWIWKGGQDDIASVSLTFMDSGAGMFIVHDMAFRSSGGRFDLAEEKIRNLSRPDGMEQGYYYSNGVSGGGPIVVRVTSSDDKDWESAPDTKGRSILAVLREPRQYPEITWIAEAYERVRIYREWSFGRHSVLRSPQRADMRNDMLEEDFSNLGLFLSKLRKSPGAKRAMLSGLQDLYEGISDFEVAVEGGTVQVFFTEGDYAIPAMRLSDGTLRYLCLLAILCDPEPPPLICIEEPELGLHPDILPKLADLLKSASERTQIIVTTHSDILVDAMTDTPEAVVVCEKHDGRTEMSRLSKESLGEWLQRYRLGQLWIDGQLGGKRW